MEVSTLTAMMASVVDESESEAATSVEASSVITLAPLLGLGLASLVSLVFY